jgi:hypothetical protein
VSLKNEIETILAAAGRRDDEADDLEALSAAVVRLAEAVDEIAKRQGVEDDIRRGVSEAI